MKEESEGTEQADIDSTEGTTRVLVLTISFWVARELMEDESEWTEERDGDLIIASWWLFRIKYETLEPILYSWVN